MRAGLRIGLGVLAVFLPSRAPGERQPPAAGLYSGTMMMLSPYRPVSAPVLNPAPSPAECGANGGATGFGAEIFFNRAIYASHRGVPLKMGNFVGVLSNSSPAPASRSVRLSVSAPLPPAPVPRLLSGAVGRSRYYRGLLGPDEARPLFEDLDLDQVGVGDRSWAVIMNPPGFTGAVTPLCRPAPFRWREAAPPA